MPLARRRVVASLRRRVVQRPPERACEAHAKEFDGRQTRRNRESCFQFIRRRFSLHDAPIPPLSSTVSLRNTSRHTKELDYFVEPYNCHSFNLVLKQKEKEEKKEKKRKEQNRISVISRQTKDLGLLVVRTIQRYNRICTFDRKSKIKRVI